MNDILPDAVLAKAAECLKIMAHPIRLKIVNFLMQRQYTVNELALLCALPPNQICQHLRLMQTCGYLSSCRKGKMVYYHILSPQLPSLLECIRKNQACLQNNNNPQQNNFGVEPV